ncbi:sensor histidine kinase [Nocardia sp. XZ_19_385]|uniref:sensor histidine kinase n=1 Tax=Nocardia sp. XZ_19_385 TaxID=2769488 RepID=UPI00188E4892|nr:histidine kinase [Nocardia sp. XZ_19_385]
MTTPPTAIPPRGARRAGQVAMGLGLSVLMIPVDLAGALGGLFSPRASGPVVALEQARLAQLASAGLRGRPAGPRAAGYLAVRALVGALTAIILAMIGAGIVVTVSVLIGAATGGAVPLMDAPEPGRVTWTTVAVLMLPGLVLGYLGGQGLVGLVGMEVRLWNLFSRPGSGELEQRVVRLTSARAEVIDAIDEERRRIERDIHDGVQQRVVALSILLGRAERETEPGERADMHRRALAETRNILDDLRAVSWRIYPAMLDRDGLRSALDALADRTPVPTHVDYRVTQRPPRLVESACYFTASEAITNVIKHAAAQRVDIAVTQGAGLLTMVVRDDGHGGADPMGHGLSGIAARITALDGTMAIDSPAGGPTTIRVEVPCA